VAYAEVGGPLPLEGLDLRAEDVEARAGHLGEAAGDLLLVPLEGGGEERYGHAPLP
jgi:hypothetical protein